MILVHDPTMLELSFTPTPCMVDQLGIAKNQETWNC